MEPCKAITKKHFVSEEESNREEVTLTPQDRISNINWCECGYECKPIITFVESFNLLLRLNPGARGERLTIQPLRATA